MKKIPQVERMPKMPPRQERKSHKSKVFKKYEHNVAKFVAWRFMT